VTIGRHFVLLCVKSFLYDNVARFLCDSLLLIKAYRSQSRQLCQVVVQSGICVRNSGVATACWHVDRRGLRLPTSTCCEPRTKSAWPERFVVETPRNKTCWSSCRSHSTRLYRRNGHMSNLCRQ